MHYECTKSARFYAIIGKRECDLMFPKNVRFHEVSSAKRKKKKKKGTTRNVNIKMDLKHRVPRRPFGGKNWIEERSWTKGNIFDSF